jgi:hypothetical protein
MCRKTISEHHGWGPGLHRQIGRKPFSFVCKGAAFGPADSLRIIHQSGRPKVDIFGWSAPQWILVSLVCVFSELLGWNSILGDSSCATQETSVRLSHLIHNELSRSLDIRGMSSHQFLKATFLICGRVIIVHCFQCTFVDLSSCACYDSSHVPCLASVFCVVFVHICFRVILCVYIPSLYVCMCVCVLWFALLTCAAFLFAAVTGPV